MSEPVKIGLLGRGTVGGAFAELLDRLFFQREVGQQMLLVEIDAISHHPLGINFSLDPLAQFPTEQQSVVMVTA